MAGGGSLLTVPVMLFMGVPGPVANGTNRIAILAQNVVAVGTFLQGGHVRVRLALTLTAAAVPGALAGAFLGTRLGGVWFDRVLAAIMIGVMILMASGRGSRRRDDAQTTSPSRLVWGHVCMVGAGFWGGFIQIGIGFVLMPILHRVMGLDLVRVNALKVFVVLGYTLVALAVFASQVELLWGMGLALAAGNALGGWLGAKTTIGRGEGLIRIVFNAVLVVFIVKLLFF